MTKLDRKAKTTLQIMSGSHRLCVALSELTLAKRPAESAHISELHAAIKALARQAARSDHHKDS